MNKDELLKIQDEIILAGLEDVAFDGWSYETFRIAAERAGHNRGVVDAVFPSGLRDIYTGFSDLADSGMLKKLEEIKPEDLKIRERVKVALMARYDYLIPYREGVRQSLQYVALPTRKPLAAKVVWRTADRIWNWAGDTSTDYNRYTKRGLLSGIIVASTLYWLSDDAIDLDGFVERRIENVMKVGGVLGRFKKAG